ncbi:hypothetical protein [Aeromonas taiwanensis]|uniref:hypothetical protein n=1 Tax=Aeromonas taiwanensis TaxID=633417 RepID=UPI0005C17DC1|nr:hypothetical protein [Aeromonas taiwanensis]MCO4203290.1 hypothetical protein [Aeromonas taiwanensis]
MKLTKTALLMGVLLTSSIVNANPQAACNDALSDRGYGDAVQKRVQIMDSRSGTSVTGQLSRSNGDRFEFNCVLDSQGGLMDVLVNPLPGNKPSSRTLGRHALSNCVHETAAEWEVSPKAVEAGRAQYTGDGMFDVEMRGDNGNVAVCTVEEDGTVRAIMND